MIGYSPTIHPGERRRRIYRIECENRLGRPRRLLAWEEIVVRVHASGTAPQGQAEEETLVPESRVLAVEFAEGATVPARHPETDAPLGSDVSHDGSLLALYSICRAAQLAADQVAP